jgi:hypothetical protein
MPGREYDGMGETRTAYQRRAAALQAAYYVPTGIWPLVPYIGMRTFEWITGPKVDRWLVQTVGAIVGVIGVVIGRARAHDRITPEIEILAVGSALSLATVDVVFVARRRISPIYLADAALNLIIVGLWLTGRRSRS